MLNMRAVQIAALEQANAILGDRTFTPAPRGGVDFNQRSEMTDSPAKNLSAALVAAQAEMPKVAKNGRNPHFNSQFVTLDDLLEAVRPVLNKHGLAVVQLPCELPEGRTGLTTSLLHTSGETVEATMPLTLQRQDMQAVGAAITYARRYMLAAALGIAEGVDDDGNQASAPVNARSEDVPVGGPQAYPVPRSWAKVQEAVRMCDNPDEAWQLFEAFVRAASYHLYGETEGRKLEPDQRKVMLQKAAGAAIWLHGDDGTSAIEGANVPYQGEFKYFLEGDIRAAWASVLDGTILEIPDYKPASVRAEEAEVERLQAEYEASVRGDVDEALTS